MSLTKEEALAALECAKNYPPGHGTNLFIKNEEVRRAAGSTGIHISSLVMYNEAAKLLRFNPHLLKFG